MVRKKIFDLKQEVLEIASAKKHNWTDDEFNGEDPYGKADSTHYGHVKILGTIPENTTNYDSDAANIGAIKSYVQSENPQIIKNTETDVDNYPDNLLSASVIKNLITKLITDAKNALTTNDIKVPAVTNPDTEEVISAETTLDTKLQNIEQTIANNFNPNNIDLTSPKTIEEGIDIDSLKTPGYYYYNKNETIELPYDSVPIHYKNALIVVEAQPNGNILQYIYATEEELTDSTEPEPTEPEPTEPEPTEPEPEGGE